MFTEELSVNFVDGGKVVHVLHENLKMTVDQLSAEGRPCRRRTVVFTT